jgi:hypothetical protein
MSPSIKSSMSSVRLAAPSSWSRASSPGELTRTPGSPKPAAKAILEPLAATISSTRVEAALAGSHDGRPRGRYLYSAQPFHHQAGVGSRRGFRCSVRPTGRTSENRSWRGSSSALSWTRRLPSPASLARVFVDQIHGRDGTYEYRDIPSALPAAACGSQKLVRGPGWLRVMETDGGGVRKCGSGNRPSLLTS